jgi:type II secretory pathway pseudopilin PulG
MKRTGERGFTLIELVAVIVFFISLLALSLFLLRTTDYSMVSRDSKRRTDIAHIAQALNHYAADTGELPSGITTKVKAISSGSGHYDLCKYLVPKYLDDIPLDPSLGVKAINNNTEPTRENCSAAGVGYASGYTIKQNSNGTIVIAAPVAEGEKAINITLPKATSDLNQ